jgi:2',3'-cyclic-nucleotide 2'-phosphodiesterase (5'-nucleotidase family)
VDAGDFAVLNPGASGTWETTEYISQIMGGKLDYDAWTPGERELFLGMGNFLKVSEHMQADLVSANITDTSGKLLFKDHIVKQLGNIRVGITGATAKTVFQAAPTGANKGEGDFAFSDVFESLKPVVAKLDKETDVVVVLAHVGAGDARRIAEEVPGIDVIVVGHNPGYMYSPDRVGDVLLVRNGNRGQYAAKLTLTFDSKKEISDYKGVVEPLNEGVAVEPSLGSDIAKFQEQMAKLQAEEARKQHVQNTGGNKFVGDEICARCHSDVYTKWAQGPHARAFQTLATAHKEKDQSCIGCHVTGWEQPTGYQMMVFKTDAAGKPDTTDSVELRNVQCEACHGMGTLHGSPGMVTKVSKEACEKCHDAANDKDFNFEKAIAAGQHH